mmetsp:Transcript_111953/g.316434  ORF Transcript_111953/g.316434 Transcript_111953/m.316434 type:complete len:298 (+) Transcript_111953:118-1011(+)
MRTWPPTVVGTPVGGYDRPGKHQSQYDDEVEMGRPPRRPEGRAAAGVGAQVANPNVSGASTWRVPQEEWFATQHPDKMIGEDRANFIRKVYGILTFQMSITVAICAAAMVVPPVQSAFLHLMAMPYAQFAIFIPAMCVMCALSAYRSEHPTNYYLLVTFTVLMSISIAGICAVYQKVGLGTLILQAFFVTAVAFGSLSLYALKSGKDFSWLGGMLFMGLMGMLAFGFFGWLFGFHGGVLFSLMGVVLFCGFVLYDTSMILKVYGPDDAIVASVELYLDILNLFLYILELLSRCNDGD